VVAVGCTVPYETAGGGYYEERVDRGGYYGSSPYGSNVIVVERDPYTGRYYEVSPYGSYGYPVGGRGVYNTPRGNSRYYNNRDTRYNNSVRDGGSYRNNNNQQYRQQQTEQRQQQRQADVRQMESTKESILGKKKD
jgi:hypothetical protein